MTFAAEHPGEAAAVIARRKWGLGTERPVDDLVRLVEGSAAIPVLIERFDADDIAGVLLRHADGASYVAINADHVAPRQRFTLAHELGHHQMGHEPRVDYVTDITEGRSGDTQEVEANYFAAEFLCPRLAVSEWLSERGITTVDAGVAAQLAMQFGLSFPSACFRLERAGAITSSVKRKLQAELNANARQYVASFSSQRLMDEIERLAQDERSGIVRYPRVPSATRSYADQALQAELIDREEYDHIVRAATQQPDFSAWIA